MSSDSSSGVGRRDLLKGAAAAGAAVVALPATAADRGALKSPTVRSDEVSFKCGEATINGFLARPSGDKPAVAVILIPGIFGISPYMKESTAQVAAAGMVGLCVDFYSRVGGAPKTDDFAILREVVGKISDEQLVGDVLAGLDYLKTRPFVTPKFGVTGFCMGGRYTLLTAAASKEISAASPYYGQVLSSGEGRVAAMDLTEKITCPVQGHYGANDRNPRPEDVEAFYAKLKKTNPHVEHYIYPGAGHAFHDFSRPSYVPGVAEQAWDRTLTLFKQHLPG